MAFATGSLPLGLGSGLGKTGSSPAFLFPGKSSGLGGKKIDGSSQSMLRVTNRIGFACCIHLSVIEIQGSMK